MSMGSTGIPYEYAFPAQPLPAMGAMGTGTKRRADEAPNTRSVKAKTEEKNEKNENSQK